MGPPRIQVPVSFDTQKQEAGSLWLNGNLPKRQMEEKRKREWNKTPG